MENTRHNYTMHILRQVSKWKKETTHKHNIERGTFRIEYLVNIL